MQQGYFTHILIVLLILAACVWLLATYVSGGFAAIVAIVGVIYIVAVTLDGRRIP